MHAICDDLLDEHADLDAIVADLDEQQWSQATPAAGWSVRDQISHLWFFDQRAALAMSDPDGFAADMQQLLAAGGTAASVEPGRAISGAELLAAWRRDRSALVSLARSIDPAARVPWYGPAMGARSFITARLMETWAHGQDVADALSVRRAPTARLRHVAHLGVRARPFSYAVRGLTMPPVPVHVSLTAPDGSLWEWDEPVDDWVRGSALDFCLVATQRRHPADTGLQVHGPAATEWIGIAQAFAGGVGEGRRPGQFAR
ncbi:MAG: TIGR03084 family metal-binding protein [Actinomycetota bacterium]|nr:TIGR03084 family metal-binding protein [Actinomycetota bacterium]